MKDKKGGIIMQIPEVIRTPEDVWKSINNGVIDVVESQIDALYAEYEKN